MRDSGRVFIQMRMSRSPHIREWNNSWILDSTSWIPDSRYWIPIFFRGTSILESNRKWDSGFLEQKVPGPPYVGRSKLCWQDRELAKFGIDLKHFFIYFQVFIEKQPLTLLQRSLPSIDGKTLVPKRSLNSLVKDNANINSTFTFSTEQWCCLIQVTPFQHFSGSSLNTPSDVCMISQDCHLQTRKLPSPTEPSTIPLIWECYWPKKPRLKKQPDISRRHRWFAREMTPEKRGQKFHTDIESLSRSG